MLYLPLLLALSYACYRWLKAEGRVRELEADVATLKLERDAAVKLVEKRWEWMRN